MNGIHLDRHALWNSSRKSTVAGGRIERTTPVAAQCQHPADNLGRGEYLTKASDVAVIHDGIIAVVPIGVPPCAESF